LKRGFGRVDRLDDTETNVVIAIGADAVDAPQQEVAEAHLGQALPPQRLEPSFEEVENAKPGLERARDSAASGSLDGLSALAYRQRVAVQIDA
jgi:hypothetical protein